MKLAVNILLCFQINLFTNYNETKILLCLFVSNNEH